MSKLICLDAGHGGTDPGACANGLKEKDITLKAVKKMGALLEKQGVDVVYTRTKDIYTALGERCRIANSRKCDAFVSIHNNAAVNAAANGIETLCYTKNNLAYYIQQNLIDELKLADRGVKERKDLYVLNSTDMQAVLVELGFISNVKEAGLLKDENFLDRAIKCIVKGICKYLSVNYKEDNKMWVDEIKRDYKYNGITEQFKVLSYNENNYVSIRDLTKLLGKSIIYYNDSKLTEIKD